MNHCTEPIGPFAVYVIKKLYGHCGDGSTALVGFSAVAYSQEEAGQISNALETKCKVVSFMVVRTDICSRT